MLRCGAKAASVPRRCRRGQHTPLMGVPLDGAIMQIGPARHVHDELRARCLVLDDGATRLAFAIVDNTMISREVMDHAKRLIQESAGIPPERVLIAATHTHSTPRAVTGLSDDPLHKDYLHYLAQRIKRLRRQKARAPQPSADLCARGHRARQRLIRLPAHRPGPARAARAGALMRL